MNNEYLRNQRKNLIADQKLVLVGEAARERDMDDQRFAVAAFVRECYDRGFDPVTLAQSLLVGAAWLGDNTGISRAAMAKVIHMAKLPDGAQLSIIKP